MKKNIITYFKHLFLTILALLVTGIVVGLSIGASVHYGDNPKAYMLENEGPYVFYVNDTSLSVNYVNGSRSVGYQLQKEVIALNELKEATCYNYLDSTQFAVPIYTDYKTPASVYNDDNKIVAISDIEGNYITFRDMLISLQVMDDRLNWTFGTGHLVLVGDFVDRGAFVTQVLWLIYKLEKEAQDKGGQVHYIIGNHELKAMEGNTMSASPKYFRVASVLDKNQVELYDHNSLIGKWLSTKNSIEWINGHLFVHGGLHPDLMDHEVTLEDMNKMIRESYYHTYYPTAHVDLKQLLTSTETGPCWYRGMLKGDIEQEQLDALLNKFNARDIVMGHTLQGKINRSYNEKVIGIDVKHPSDDHLNWPVGKSEALLIDQDRYYRIVSNGSKEEL